MGTESGTNRADEAQFKAPDIEIFIGSLDVSSWRSLEFRDRKVVNGFSSVSFSLSREVLQNPTLDYSGIVQINYVVRGEPRVPSFVGVIDSVEISDAGLVFHCTTGTELQDTFIRNMAHDKLSPSELAWTIVRNSGVPRERVDIPAVEEIQPEEIEVFIPIQGLEVDREVEFRPGESIVPAESVDWIRQPWPVGVPGQIGAPERIIAEFLRHRSFVKATSTARLLYDAERSGIEDAELISAWLSTRLGFTTATLPNGNVQEFFRVNSRARPQPSRLVAVRASISGRRWIRIPEGVPRLEHAALPLTPQGRIEPRPPEQIEAADKEAILGLWRSRALANPLSSVVALFDAIEFYVGGRSAPKIFSREDLAKLKEEVPGWMTAEQQRRYKQALPSALNNSPLFARLRVAIQEDGVPVEDSEIELFRRLRRVRNPAQHGQERRMPDPDDLRQGWALASRLLLFKLAERGHNAP